MSENKRVFCKETRLFHKLKIVDRSGKNASAKKPRAILSTPKSARNYVKYAERQALPPNRRKTQNAAKGAQIQRTGEELTPSARRVDTSREATSSS